MQAVGPAGFVVHRTFFLLEFHVELGEHEEQRGVSALPEFGRLSCGVGHPVVDDGGQILHFLIARADAQEHTGQFEIGLVALEEVGHLAAQEELADLIGLGEFAGHVVGLEARAVAGEVEQVGVFEKIVRLVAHGDGQFRRERGDFRSARRDPASVLRDQFEAVRALCLSKAAQRFHVDDAGFAGEQGFLAAKRLIGIAERVEHPAQAQVERRKRFGLVPQDFEQRGAIFGCEASGGVDGLGPVQVLKPLDHGGGPEIPGDVFLQVYHIVFAEGGPPRFAFGLFRQCVHAGGEGVLVGRGEVAAVGVVGIRQDFDDIQFGQQAQFHGKHGRGAARRQGEARDEARGLLAARRVDVLNEIGGFVAECRKQRAVGILRQRRDEVGLSGLARAEHAHAHFPRGGGGFLAQGTGEPVALAQERLAGGACGLRVCPDPFVNAGERFDARFALFDKFLIVYGHKRNASRRAGENRSACDARKARKLVQRSRRRRPLGRIPPRPPQSGGAVLHAETLRFFSAKHCAAVPSESVVPLFHVVERQEAAPCFSSRGTGGFRQGTILCGSGCFSCETGKLCQETVRRGSATVSRPLQSSAFLQNVKDARIKPVALVGGEGLKTDFEVAGIDRGAVHGFNFIDGEFPLVP